MHTWMHIRMHTHASTHIQVASLVADEVVRQKAFSDQKTPEVLVVACVVLG